MPEAPKLDAKPKGKGKGKGILGLPWWAWVSAAAVGVVLALVLWRKGSLTPSTPDQASQPEQAPQPAQAADPFDLAAWLDALGFTEYLPPDVPLIPVDPIPHHPHTGGGGSSDGDTGGDAPGQTPAPSSTYVWQPPAPIVQGDQGPAYFTGDPNVSRLPQNPVPGQPPVAV